MSKSCLGAPNRWRTTELCVCVCVCVCERENELGYSTYGLSRVHAEVVRLFTSFHRTKNRRAAAHLRNSCVTFSVDVNPCSHFLMSSPATLRRCRQIIMDKVRLDDAFGHWCADGLLAPRLSSNLLRGRSAEGKLDAPDQGVEALKSAAASLNDGEELIPSLTAMALTFADGER